MQLKIDALKEAAADPALHVVPDASHWPQHDQPQRVADLLAAIASTQSQR